MLRSQYRYVAIPNKSQYLSEERSKAIACVATEEDLNVDILNHYLSEYDYLQKEQPEIIQEALKEKHLGLSKRRKTMERILEIGRAHV